MPFDMANRPELFPKNIMPWDQYMAGVRWLGVEWMASRFILGLAGRCPYCDNGEA